MAIPKPACFPLAKMNVNIARSTFGVESVFSHILNARNCDDTQRGGMEDWYMCDPGPAMVPVNRRTQAKLWLRVNVQAKE